MQIATLALFLTGATVAHGAIATPRPRRSQLVAEASSRGSLAQTASDPVADGFKGASLGMKGMGFQAGFVGSTPAFGKLKFPSPYAIDPMRCPTGMWHVQCAYDTQTAQQIWFHEEMAKEDRVPMTPEVCYTFCKNVSGVQFMGLRNGDECYCTPFFHNTDKGGHGGCDLPCTGDASRMCGGQKMADIYQLHDCKNLPALPCKNPPKPVPHAKLFESRYYRRGGENLMTNCQNSIDKPLTTFNQLCVVECDFGYEIFENTLKCEEKGNPLVYSWAQLVGSATCTPVSCGLPPTVLHTKHPHTAIYYPNLAHYTCDLGYTLDQTAQGVKAFEITCQGTAEFTETVPCLPVSCGMCPLARDDEKYAHSHPIEEMERVYLQRCNYVCDDGYTLDQTAAGPKRHSLSCMATAEFTEPRICRPVICGSPPQFAFTALEGPHDRDENVVFPEKVSYKCDTGYTHNQVPTGPVDFDIECQASGTFSPHTECKPVLCGPPVHVDHSSYNERSLVYLETVTYLCDYGYTLTGIAGERTTKTIMCGSDGQFEEDAPVCHPVECGNPPTVERGEVQDVATDSIIHFESPPLSYTCDPGWSTAARDTAWAPYVSNSQEVLCQADGTFETPAPCVNINDCAFVACGAHGSCEDNAFPTGTHLDDYTCKCNSGYEITLHDSTFREGEQMKKCTNINDCPRPIDENCGGLNAAGFRRGSCTDLINDYDCVCEAGYEVTRVPPSNKTCTPKSCGHVPEVPHALSSFADEANYDTPPWEVTCDEGYTLSGRAGGRNSFEMRCTASATFTAPKVCKPVTCGSPPRVRYGDQSPKVDELFFPKEAWYLCEEGYSTDAKADGDIEFSVECQSTGEHTEPAKCQPVECGVIPHHDHASWSEDRIIVYTRTGDVHCETGYSLDGTTNPAVKSYKLPCLSHGEFAPTKTCQKIKCGPAPLVIHADCSADDKFYMDKVEYQLDLGYTLDGHADGEKVFEVECWADGTFSPGKEPKPVSCGLAPEREKATTPKAEYHFDAQGPVYTCLTGYSTDGKADGPKTFTLECDADGDFKGPDGCLPVECGAVEQPANTEQVDDDGGARHSELVYGQHAAFKCKTGWSLDGILFSNVRFGKVVCQDDGELHYPPVCLNVDDCASPENMCSKNGKCKDNEEPSGEHVNDLTCECDSGFGHDETDEGVHFCYNLPDCPDGACEPGTCEDLVNDYKCHCPDGYHEDANPELDLAHDCLPNLCGVPPQVPHASTPDHDKDFYFDDPAVEFECDEGYSLDGTAGGERKFHLPCLADKSFEVAPECKPVRCGVVPEVTHSRFPMGSELVYPEVVNYVCEEGYSTDQTYMALLQQPAHSNATNYLAAKASRRAENTEFTAECQADGTYTEVEQCLPIKCPEVPAQDHVTVDQGGSELHFPMEVSETCAAGFALNEFEHDETTYTISCEANGELKYSYEESEGCTAINCGDLPAPKNAEVEGSTLFGELMTVTCHEGHSTSRTCAKADAGYEFSCMASGAFGAHPDCERVKCPEPFHLEHATHATGDFYYTDKVMYSAEVGYTLTGKADGLRAFELTCEADCTYSGKKFFKPVECGAPPERQNSKNPAVHRVFEQKEPYTCIGGHTVDGKATSAKSFELTCTAEGEYDGHTGCSPVECGEVETPKNAEYNGDKGELVFPEKAEFTCLAGFSLNGRLQGGTEFHTACLADGQQSEHEGCLNMDDCEGNTCGPNGRCVDHENPTGNHMDDYHCDCDSGFEEEVEDGKKVCGNIPDCPEDACLPGSCEDLVNDYKCHCPDGYYEDENPEEGLDHDCLPKKCGAPPSIDKASAAEEGTDIFFNSEPVEYTCDEGYSLDGAAGGPATFEVKCLADGKFSEKQECKPVKCGSAPEVAFSKTEAGKQMSFPEKLEYTCEKGYTTDGTAAGSTTFELSCEASGDFAGLLSCEPVACPEVPSQENAEYSEGATLVFPMELTATCQRGYALHEDKLHEVEYTISCTSDGELKFSNDAGCAPISCGPLPHVDHGKVDGGQLFGEEATVTCDEGFSVDQTVDKASAEYIISCQADGEYTAVQDCLPVLCGAAQEVEHSSNTGSGSKKVFEDEVTYNLAKGYTLDGESGGDREFKTTCQMDGTFTALKVPQPVSCGEPPSLKKASAHGKLYVFPDEAPYSCEAGYSLDGTPGGATSFVLKCGEDGKYKGPEGCKAIKCGKVETPPHSKQVEDQDGKKLTSLVFPETAKFECLPGYSKDGILGSELLAMVVSCQGDGSIHYPAQCQNNDDCQSPENACSQNGQCADKKDPTGKHEDDFQCECDSGFEESVDDHGFKSCQNIPDCPKEACKPGSCTDLVNDYECVCPKGYYQGENAQAGFPYDCLPKECGTPPSVKHASTEVTASIFYDSDPVAFTCGEGYTLDGIAGGDVEFTLPCLETGMFADPAVCHPVNCGVPPEVASSTASTGNALTFSEEVTYTCHEGWSSDGSVDKDKRSFQATCTAEGVFDNVLACERVRCETPVPPQEHADVVEDGAKLVFEGFAVVTCLPGFSVSKYDRTKNAYDIKCQANGELLIPEDTCKPIDCSAEAHAGHVPEVKDAKVSGSPTFGGDLKATAMDGYSLDGSASGEKTFDIICEASGDYGPEPLPEFQRVACDLPQFPHTENVELVEGALLQLAAMRPAGAEHLHWASPHHGRGIEVHHALSQASGHASGAAHRTARTGRREPEPLFGDVVRYTCSEGYRVSSTQSAGAGAAQEFKLRCGKDGDMESVEPDGVAMACAPVECPIAEGIGMDFVLHGGNTCGGTDLGEHEGTATQCMQTCRTLADCSGFVRVNAGSDAGKCFMLGDVSTPETYTEDIRDCYVRNPHMQLPVAAEGESFPLIRVFEGTQGYTCIPGYSLSGAPDGEVEFEEACLATGEMTTEHECKDIDWCVDNKCGEHGSCHDGLLSYHCECENGYKIEYVDGVHESCVEIDECAALDGADNCEAGREMGTCVDEVGKYKCECNDGYQNVESGEHGLDGCEPKTCEPLLPVEHATPTHIPKLTYEDTLKLTCDPGYTLDGTTTGHIGFTVTCEADSTVSGVEECKPVDCGDTVSVDHATVEPSKLIFGEEATYTCDEGHTATGTPAGLGSFTVSCGADGVITQALECRPISCGIPPAVANARTPKDTLTYGMEATYACNHGYTTTGHADGETEFVTTCPLNGELEGVKACMPVKCGYPEAVKHAEMPKVEYAYPEQFEVSCHSGYTVDEDPDGESTFIVKCSADGEFAGYKECKPVKCGIPENTDAADTEGESKFYRDQAVWTCKDGFSVDGTPKGGTKFAKECGATGLFGAASPSDCVDIDFCVGDPCTANGVCADSGSGVTGPGYSCECFEGFEVKERDDGSPKCSEDDCAGSPCGNGGTCTDMSEEGAPGMYSCDCDAGYALVTPEADRPTCERVECGHVRTLPHVLLDLEGKPAVNVKTWHGNDPETSVLYGTANLYSFDQVTYTCADGYSTDGTTHIESKDFRVTCQASGLFSPTLDEGASYCVPIECDNTFIPEISYTEVPGGLGKYSFGDQVEFHCSEGYTTTGEVGGPATFELMCEENGLFTADHPACVPVNCPVTEHAHAISTATGMIHYGQAVTYTCMDGFYLGGAVSDSTKNFGGACTKQGTIDLDISSPSCEPCSCGAPVGGSNAAILVPGPGFYDFFQLSNKPKAAVPARAKHHYNMLAAQGRHGRKRGGHHSHRQDDDVWVELAPGESLHFDEVALIVCDEGHTVGGVPGGADYYEITCGPDGSFTAGTPSEGACLAPKFSVSGEVVDAQNGRTKLAGVSVSFEAGDGTTTAPVTTGPNGRYTVQLPMGKYTAKAMKSGWITREKQITVAGAIQKGQGADLAMSQVLPPGGYRIVLNWGAHSRDLDSWTYFSGSLKSYVYYGRTSRSSAETGVSVTLDWDDVDGYGPETTTWLGVGKCKEGCLIKFHVDNYSWRDAHLADSEGIVTVYKGDGIAATYHIPTDIGDDRGWTIFTLDASDEKLYEGDWTHGPWIKKANGISGSTDWSKSMDAEGWSKVPEGAVLYGLSAYSLRQLNKLGTAYWYEVQDTIGGAVVSEVDWTGILEGGGQAECPPGSWISALYRVGGKGEPTGGHQIVKAACSAFKDVEEWGECKDVNVFEDRGQEAAECPHLENGQPTAMVGLKHEGYPKNDKLSGIVSAKCCSMPKALVKTQVSDLCIMTQSCVGIWEKGSR